MINSELISFFFILGFNKLKTFYKTNIASKHRHKNNTSSSYTSIQKNLPFTQNQRQKDTDTAAPKDKAELPLSSNFRRARAKFLAQEFRDFF